MKTIRNKKSGAAKASLLSFLFKPCSVQHAGGVGNSLWTVVVGDTVVLADAGDEEPVGFHRGHGLVWEPAGLRVGTLRADAAAAGPENEAVRMVFPNVVREGEECIAQTRFGLGVTFDVDPFLLRPGHLEEDAVFVLLHLSFTFFQRAAGRGTGPVVAIRVAFVLSAGVPHPGLDLKGGDVQGRCMVKAALLREGEVTFREVAHVSPPPVA